MKYVDENGDPIDPSELEDFEAVEQPAPPAPTAASTTEAATLAEVPGGGVRIPKALIAGAAVVVLGLGGGLAYAMSQIGDRNTAGDVKSAVSSAAAPAMSSASAKASAAKATARRVTGAVCDGKAIAGAAWPEEGATPTTQLRTTDVIPMGHGFSKRRIDAEEEGQKAKLAMLQLSDEQLGVYVASTANAQSNGDAVWWKTTVAITGGFATLGETYGDGRDRDMRGACDTIAGGPYRVVGESGSEEKPVEVLMLKPSATDEGTVYALIGDKLAKAVVEHVPDEAEK
ncbi:MAG: hypothetical protein QM809_10245 [Gordonia sp. (in: high G+C Gram-positive bacteria)]|uniref:hypothetical protein n=1 Tax=Gordonia sp. (in: high G+C Gram-positive bacteria) TaxID=84139 RepID=UPI0039E62AB9